MAAGMAVGGGMNIIGNLMQGDETKDALDMQAGIQTKNAALTRQKSAYDANRLALMSGRVFDTMTSRYAASGVDANSGSVLAVMGASHANAEMDRQQIIYGGELKAQHFEMQSFLDQIAGQNAKDASYFGAAGAGVSAGSKLYSYGAGGSGDDEG